MELSTSYGTWYVLYSSIWYMVCTITTMQPYKVHSMYHVNLYMVAGRDLCQSYKLTQHFLTYVMCLRADWGRDHHCSCQVTNLPPVSVTAF